MTREKEFFRQVMGQFATGVTIVTTATTEGVFGLTVNAFTSVSLDPPLIAICVDVRSQTLSCLRASGSFAVNVLGAEQEALSQCFATPSAERYGSFCHVPYQVAVTGSPVLSGVLAFLDARIVAEYPGGDHVIILGQVEAMGASGIIQRLKADGTEHGTLTVWGDERSDNARQPEQFTKTPLVYYQGQYRYLARNDERPSLAASFAEDVKGELICLSNSSASGVEYLITKQEK
jgi:flavin reductase (DIM6/NTAB) family NADH-FMN oxidoreductase RutF